MDQALANALKEKKELQRRLAEIDEFLRLYRRFSDTDQGPDSEESPVENRAEPIHRGPREPIQGPTRKGPKAVVDVSTGILQDAGQPLTRGELATELELRKVMLPGKDAESRARYVGTIMWRYRHDRFEHIPGKGYWLRGVPIPETEEEKRALRLERTLI
jgi:hypothetical protein